MISLKWKLRNKGILNKIFRPDFVSFPILAAIIIFYILQLIITSVLLYYLLLNYTSGQLAVFSKKVISDLSYDSGQWNLSEYNSDPNITELSPLYIITSDGSVIERMNPIHGFLDKSSTSRLSSYSIPQTVHTVTNDNWRVFSEQIVVNGNARGLILIATYNPNGNDLKNIDSTLKSYADSINSNLKFVDNKIDVSGIDPKHFPYDIAFQVIDQFNNIVLKSNNGNGMQRLPDYIDRSYVGSTLSLPSFFQKTDSVTNVPFLVSNNKILDKNNNTIAIVVAARQIGYIYHTIITLFIVEFGIGIFSVFLLISFVNNAVKIHILKFLRKNNINYYEIKAVTKIAFSKSEHSILINDKVINIPFATNQYYFCDALFSNPTKKWETDELLDRFGEDDLTKWHKVYDTMKLINNRLTYILHDKLFIVRNKRYQINPVFQKSIV